MEVGKRYLIQKIGGDADIHEVKVIETSGQYVKIQKPNYSPEWIDSKKYSVLAALENEFDPRKSCPLFRKEA